MSRRPLVLALAFALSPLAAHAEDLLQTYELARAGDPQLLRRRIQPPRHPRRLGAGARGAAAADRTAARRTRAPHRLRPATQVFGTTVDQRRHQRHHHAQLRPQPVDQMVYDHSNITRLRSANALSEASDFQLESASDSLITRTSAAYFNVLVQLENLAAAEAAETALKKQFDFASKRLEVGLAPITDVHEARAQYDSARANTITARNPSRTPTRRSPKSPASRSPTSRRCRKTSSRNCPDTRARTTGSRRRSTTTPR